MPADLATSTTAQKPAPNTFDPVEIERLRSSLAEDADAIIALFVRETASRLGRMARLGSADQREALSREAHSLKSAAATFGCHALAELACAIEGDAMTLDAASFPVRIDALSDAFEAARAALLTRPS